MAYMNFYYYKRGWHTAETDTDEIIVYDYEDYFMDSRDMHINETDIYDNYRNQLEFELTNQMIVEYGYYPKHIKQIIFDMVKRHDCQLVSVNDYEIRTDIFCAYEIQLFVEIMQAANNDAITIQFYFGDYADAIKDINNIFVINC